MTLSIYISFTASLLEKPLYLSTGVISPSLNLCREKCSNARPNLINFVSTGRNIHCRVAYVPGAHDPSSTTLVSAAYIALVLNEHIALIVRKQFKFMSAPVFFFCTYMLYMLYAPDRAHTHTYAHTLNIYTQTLWQGPDHSAADATHKHIHTNTMTGC